MSLIITPDQPTPENAAPETADEIGESLNIDVVTRIGGALDHLRQLESQAIATPTSEATKRALREFLFKSFTRHGSELLGAYFTLKGEYEPLIGTLSILFRRVNATINTMHRQEAAHRAAQVKAQANDQAQDQSPNK